MRLLKTILLMLLMAPTLLIAQEVDVVLIGGQSNTTGQGYMRNIPRSFEIDRSVLFYYSQYLGGGESSRVWGPLCQASETKDKFGVELSMGSMLQAELPDRKIAIIKHALSGSHLYGQWNPGNREGETMGEEYHKFISTVREALDKLISQGYKPVIRAMVWQQGEGDARFDAGIENSLRYAENLGNMIREIRREFDCEKMLFVYGEVMPMAAERFTARDIVRSCQVAVSEAAEGPFSVKGAYLVEGDDLQMRRNDYRTPMPEDDVHLGTFGILTLGERFARVIIDNM